MTPVNSRALTICIDIPVQFSTWLSIGTTPRSCDGSYLAMHLESLEKFNERTLVFVTEGRLLSEVARAEVVASVHDQIGALI